MQGQFSTAADIFSLGISLLELACDLELPSGGPTWQQLREGELPLEFLSREDSRLGDDVGLTSLSPLPSLPLLTWSIYRSIS